MSRPLPPSPEDPKATPSTEPRDRRRKARENQVWCTYSARLLVGRLPPPPLVALAGGGAARRGPRRSANVLAIAATSPLALAGEQEARTG
jgi:hypothetical protein